MAVLSCSHKEPDKIFLLMLGFFLLENTQGDYIHDPGLERTSIMVF